MKWGTKKPPNKKGRYIVTYQGIVRQADRIKNHWNDGFSWSVLPNGGYATESDVTAWIKQPEPYQP